MLTIEPTLVPKDVKAQFELPNTVEVTWTLPSSEPNLNFTGFQIRVNEITSKSKRDKRAINTHSRVIEVGEKVRSRKIGLSLNTEFCMIEVAINSAAGVGPFSKPVTVKIKKVKSTVMTTTEKGDTSSSKTLVVTNVTVLPKTTPLQSISKETQKKESYKTDSTTKEPTTKDPSANRLDAKARGNANKTLFYLNHKLKPMVFTLTFNTMIIFNARFQNKKKYIKRNLYHLTQKTKSMFSSMINV